MGLPDWVKKMPVVLFLAAIGALKFGFGACLLVLLGLIFTALATTLDDL